VNGVGVIGDSTNGFAMQARGNTVQDRDKGGWVKAMAYVDPTVPGPNKIVRCYNSQATGSNVYTPPCGLTYELIDAGVNRIDFGFPVIDRFISVTPFFANGHIVANLAFDLTGNQIDVFTNYNGSRFGDNTISAFYLIVF
jgi:hypothetical protein